MKKKLTQIEKNQEHALRIEAVNLSIRIPASTNPYAQQLGGGAATGRSTAQIMSDAETILKFLRG